MIINSLAQAFTSQQQVNKSEKNSVITSSMRLQSLNRDTVSFGKSLNILEPIINFENKNKFPSVRSSWKFLRKEDNYGKFADIVCTITTDNNAQIIRKHLDQVFPESMQGKLQDAIYEKNTQTYKILGYNRHEIDNCPIGKSGSEEAFEAIFWGPNG